MVDKKILKTFVFSRHTLRKPLYEYMDFIDKLDQEKFHKWEDDGKQVTKRGIEVENRLDKVLKDFYPDKIQNFQITSTNTQRTIFTAEMIATNTLNTEFDPVNVKPDKIFNAVENSYKAIFLAQLKDTYKKLYTKEMIDGKEEIVKILKQRNSETDFIEGDISFDFQSNEGFANLFGGLSNAFHITDILYSEFYDGKFPLKKLEKLRYLKEANLTLMAKIPGYSTYLSKKLLIHMLALFESKNINLDIFVGHDVNILALVTALELDISNIPNAVESVPIGAKFILNVVEKDGYKYIEIYYLYMNSITFENVEKVLLWVEDYKKFEKKLETLIK